MSKREVILLITILAISSLIMVETIYAQSIPKPPVPEFAVKYIDNSYDVPPSYSTNPYTGENITHAGYNVDNRTIQITIVNSNFAFSFGKLLFLYYNIQIKRHNVQNWIDLIPYVPNSPSGLIPQSDSQYTIISESVKSLPTNVPLDFRVQRLLVNQTSNFDIIGTSNWSNTQTVTIDTNIFPSTSGKSPSTQPSIPPDSPSSPSQSSTTSTPVQPSSENAILFGLSWGEIAIIILLCIIAALLLVVIVLRKRSAK